MLLTSVSTAQQLSRLVRTSRSVQQISGLATLDPTALTTRRSIVRQPASTRSISSGKASFSMASDSKASSTASGQQAGVAKPQAQTETVIKDYHPDLVTFSRPFARFGIMPVGGRSTAIRLQEPPNEGALWVMASTPFDEATKAKVQEMGNDVRFIVAADFVHHLYVKEWSDSFPNAKCIGVRGLEEKRKDVKWSGLYGVDGYQDSGTPEIESRYFPNFANRDVVFHHKKSSTLVVADLLFNLPANEQYSGTKAGKATSPIPFLASMTKYMSPYSAFHSSFLWLAGATEGDKGQSSADRRKQFAKDAEAVAAWKPNRIVPCHGDVVEGDGTKAWLAAFKKVSSCEGARAGWDRVGPKRGDHHLTICFL